VALNSTVAQTRVLLVVAHPVIGSGIETLLRLEERYDVRRVGSAAEAAALRDWRPHVAFVDGTLLSGARIRLGTPTLVLSGTEADGRALLRRLPEGRGWLRKDATAAEFAKMIDDIAGGPASQMTLGTLGTLVLVLLALAAVLLVIYLIWLALY
jgi:DNA-binding NarL/FixJ family response regulator